MKVSWTPLVPGMEPRDMEADRIAGEAELLLFPNPTNGEQVRLTLTAADPMVDQVNVDMHDLSGRLVLTRTLPATDGNVDQVLDLGTGITSGLYTVKVTARDFMTTQRLIIQH